MLGPCCRGKSSQLHKFSTRQMRISLAYCKRYRGHPPTLGTWNTLGGPTESIPAISSLVSNRSALLCGPYPSQANAGSCIARISISSECSRILRLYRAYPHDCRSSSTRARGDITCNFFAFMIKRMAALRICAGFHRCHCWRHFNPGLESYQF